MKGFPSTEAATGEGSAVVPPKIHRVPIKLIQHSASSIGRVVNNSALSPKFLIKRQYSYNMVNMISFIGSYNVCFIINVESEIPF